MYLDRFLLAQSHVWEQVKYEISSGYKISHWMWFIFPQLKELGISKRSLYFGITNKDEAIAYSNHTILGERLRESCNLLLILTEEQTAISIFGYVDTDKLKSCLTLFSQVDPTQTIYRKCLYRFFDEPDAATIDLLSKWTN